MDADDVPDSPRIIWSLDYGDWVHLPGHNRLVQAPMCPGFLNCDTCGRCYLRPKLPFVNSGRRVIARAAGASRNCSIWFKARWNHSFDAVNRRTSNAPP